MNQDKQMTQRVIFISYSRKDEKEKNRLLSHLGVLGNAGLIKIWSDDQIGGGTDWKHEIEQAIKQAAVAILLITANFLTSDFILRNEIPALLKRRKNEGLIILPVIARACAWETINWLKELNIRPRNAQPIWGDGGVHTDEDLAAIAKEVAQFVGMSDLESPTHFINISSDALEKSRETSDINDIKSLIAIHRRRLQILKEQKAKLGINTDASQIMEIEDIEAEIEKLKVQLDSLEGRNGLIEITIEQDKYSPDLLAAAHRSFASVLQIPPENVRITFVRTGSVIFIVQLPLKATERLIRLHKSGRRTIENLQIRQIKLIDNLVGVDLAKVNLSGFDFFLANMVRANLNTCDLQQADLRGALLRKANLNQAELTQTDLTGAYLVEADLSWSKLLGADLSYANLARANLMRANLMGANLSQANLIQGNLDTAFIIGANMNSADLRWANLNGTVLSKTNLYGTDLRGANLIGSNLQEVNLRGTKIDKTTQIEDKWRVIWEIVNYGGIETNLRGLDLKGIDLTDTKLSGLDLRDSDLSGAILMNTNLRKTDFRGANLQGANLYRADLRGAKLQEANLDQANLREAKIDEITELNDKWRVVWEIVNRGGAGRDLHHFDLVEANLNQVSMQGANLLGANLYKTNLALADLKGTDMREANMHETDLRGADLRDADLRGVDLSTVISDEYTKWPWQYDPVREKVYA